MQQLMSHNSSLDEQLLHTDAFETILSGNNLLVDLSFFCNLQHELVSSFYFNSKAIHHLFVTRKKTNKMHHCEIYFQNLCHAHKTVVFKMSKLPKVQVWTIWIKIVQISFLSNLIKFEQVWTSLIHFEHDWTSLINLDQV